MKDFCAARGLATKTDYCRLRKVREAALPAVAAEVQVVVPVAADVSGDGVHRLAQMQQSVPRHVGELIVAVLLVCCHTAIDHKRCTIDKTRFIRCKEYCRGSKLLGVAGTGIGTNT